MTNRVALAWQSIGGTVLVGLLLVGLSASRLTSPTPALRTATSARPATSTPRPAETPPGRAATDTAPPAAVDSRERAGRVAAPHALATMREQDPAPLLERVIREDGDPYVRERAVFELVEVQQQASLPLVRELAARDRDPNVRSAALANIQLLRKRYPEPTKGDLQVEVTGAAAVGAVVRIEVTVTSSVEAPHARLLLLAPPGTALGSGPRGWKGRLAAHQPERLAFELLVTEAGEFRIPVSLTLAWTPLESERTDRIVSLNTHTGAIRVESAEEGS